MFFRAATVLSLVIFALLVSSQTVTVDDADASITYTVDPKRGGWSRWVGVNAANGVNTTCNAASNCFSANINPKSALGGTWHEGSDSSWLTFQFTGTAVSAVFIIRDFAGSETNVTFLVDGQVRGDLVRAGLGSSWLYNFPAFSVSGLANTSHTFKIQGGSPNLFFLDYITYQKDLSGGSKTTSSIAASNTSDSPGTGTGNGNGSGRGNEIGAPSHNNTPIIAGAAVGGGLLVALIIGIVLLYVRRHRRWQRNSVVDLGAPAPVAEMQSLVSPYTDRPSGAGDGMNEASFVSMGTQSKADLPGKLGAGRVSSPVVRPGQGSGAGGVLPPSYDDANDAIYRRHFI